MAFGSNYVAETCGCKNHERTCIQHTVLQHVHILNSFISTVEDSRICCMAWFGQGCDAWWFSRGLWDSLRACSTYSFSRQNHISTKQQGPHQWVKMPVPRGISLHLHGNAPARAIGVLSQSKLDPWKKWPGVFPLGNPPFFPMVFSTLFQTEMEDFTKTHQEALGLPFLQLASGKLTDSYGKIT